MVNTQLPLVSVVLPAFNVKNYVGEAIRSVEAQGYENLEIIVVDDGSQDGTADLVATEFPHVRLFRKKNGGAATARNQGIRESRGEYIAFLDADDVWLPGKLHIQIDHLERRPDVDMVCGEFSWWAANSDGVFPDPAMLFPPLTDCVVDTAQSGWVYHKLLLSNYVWTSTIVMRRRLVEKIGFYDESLRLGQDYDYWLRASRESEIHLLKGISALYRKHSESATMRGVAKDNHAVRILRGAVDRWGLKSPNGEGISEAEFAERIYSICLGDAYSCYTKKSYDRARREFVECLRMKPFRLRPWFYLARVLLKV